MLLKSDINYLKENINKNSILTSSEELCCFAEDSTNIGNTLVNPDAVVFVENVEQVRKVLQYANDKKIPVICRGAGTNMVGACTCPKAGIVLNFSKMNKILDFNPVDMTMTVQPGVIVGDIKKLAESSDLFYPPDPSNFAVSTIGGSIAQSSGGAMGFKYGTTKDYILSLKVVLADGSIMQLGAGTIKDAVGYHLNQLIVGSEGTLAIVVEAKLKLIPKPEATRTVLAYFDDLQTVSTAVNKILSNSIFPSTIDFMDNNSIRTVEKFYPSGLKIDKAAMLLINFDGHKSSMNAQENSIVDVLNLSGASYIKIARTDDEIENVWIARRSSFAAAAKLAPDVLSDDIIVPRSKILDMIQGCSDICAKYGLQVCMVGHLGDGNIHPQIALNTEREKEYRNYMNAKSEIYGLVISLGGTISAEHGVGIEKLPYVEKVNDPIALECMRKIKKIFDPNNILNPEKIFKI